MRLRVVALALAFVFAGGLTAEAKPKVHKFKPPKAHKVNPHKAPKRAKIKRQKIHHG